MKGFRCWIAVSTIFVSVVGCLLGGIANAQDNPQAKLEALLKQVKESRLADTEANREREQVFLANKQEQARLLEEARAELKELEQQSDQLKAKFDANEAQLVQLDENLRDRMGHLGELFGVVRQVSGDLETQLRDSLITTQFPQRHEFLKTLSQGKQLPGVEALQQLWFLLQQEMTESGKVVRFSAPVVDAQGHERQAQVVRVGPFIATWDDRFLQYIPERGRLIEMTRQPDSDLTGIASSFAGVKQAAPMVIDPTRGTLLNLLAQKPTFSERLAQGGWVGYTILTLGVIGLLIAVWRLVALLLVSHRVHSQLRDLSAPKADNPLGRVIQAFRDHMTEKSDILELKIEEAVLKEAPHLERAQPTLKLLAAVAPLLGLLGTVVGMIATFQAITLFGTGDPKLMAGGISQALVTTVQGLIVAIPLLFCHSLLQGRSKRILQLLAQEAAGRLAEHQEKQSTSGSLAGA